MKINLNKHMDYNTWHRIKLILVLSSMPLIMTAQIQSLIRVRAEVDKSVITIGDRVLYTLTIENQKDVHIEQPGPGANLGQFEIKDYSISEKVEEDNFIRQQFNYTISVFDTGKFVIPPFPVAFTTSDTAEDYSIIQSEALEIFVKSVLTADDSEIKDIKPPETVPFNYRKWILLGVVAILIFAALLLLFYIFRQRKKGLPLFKKEVIRPAHEIALEELHLLEGNWRKGKDTVDYKLLYTELSTILRRYIENRFFIKAMEETTPEIIDSLNDVDIKIEQEKEARVALEISDLVKFAKYFPQDEETDNLFGLIRNFVEETKILFESVDRIVEVEPSMDSESEILSEKSSN
jgi:hypothetical protein